MPKNYESWTASDAVDRSLLDADIHVLSGEITNENVCRNGCFIKNPSLNL